MELVHGVSVFFGMLTVENAKSVNDNRIKSTGSASATFKFHIALFHYQNIDETGKYISLEMGKNNLLSINLDQH